MTSLVRNNERYLAFYPAVTQAFLEVSNLRVNYFIFTFSTKFSKYCRFAYAFIKAPMSPVVHPKTFTVSMMPKVVSPKFSIYILNLLLVLVDQNLPRITNPVSDLFERRPVLQYGSSMWFFGVKIFENTIRIFKFVWEILPILPIQPTVHTSPGMTQCDQKCVSKYLRNKKKLDVLIFLWRTSKSIPWYLLYSCIIER
jgi:hypothetical protein